MSALGANRVVQGLWIGERLSALERLCIRSFCAHGHEFHLYHYDDLQNVPRIDKLRLINAEEILPRSAVFRHKGGALAFFADHFRFALLHKHGGWWADMDMVCVRPLDFSDDIVFCPDHRADRLRGGVIKFPRGHFLTAALADAYSDIDRVLPWDTPSVIYHKFRRRLLFWQDSRRSIRTSDAGSGRGLMSAVRHFGLEKHIQPPSFFILPGDPVDDEIIAGAGWDFDKVLSVAPDLRCAHLCGAYFPWHNKDKDGDYPADSLYEVFKRRYPESAQ